MILVNRNFGNPALADAIGDMFKNTSNINSNVDWVPNTNVVASGSSLVAAQMNNVKSSSDANPNQGLQPDASVAATLAEVQPNITDFNNYNANSMNMFIVTEHFLKTLDKVYSKLWNESFVETGIYIPANLSTLYHGFVADNTLGASSTDFMLFKKFVDRCITAGVLLEEDRLGYKDQIMLSNLVRAQMSTYIDLPNKIVSITAPNPIDVNPDIDARAGAFHNGKKLYLMLTPYLTNESVAKGQTETSGTKVTQEPFWNCHSVRHDTNPNAGSQTWTYDVGTPVKRPVAFFKPKTAASKFGRSLPMATHLLFSLGTLAEKEEALIAGTPTPDIVVDHNDRISHIDAFTLKIKFDKLQF